MSTSQTPFTTIFDAQRTAVLQSQSAFKQSIDLGKRSNEAMLQAMETGIDASKQANDVTKAAVDAYFNALEATVPGTADGVEQLRESVHEQLDAGEEMQADTWEAIQELAKQNVDAAGQFADSYATVVDDSFDAFLEAHEQVADQTVSAAEAVEISLDE